MARPKVHTDDLRDELVIHAMDIVTHQGVAKLSVRSVAQRAGTSTTAVYSLFGSKEALQRAVLIAAHHAFTARQDEVPISDDPVTDIAGLGAVYVQWALDNPNPYDVMFGEALVGMAPSDETEQAASRAMARLANAVQRAIDQGLFRPAGVSTGLASLWAQVHGLSALALTQRLPAGADVAAAALATIDGWRT